MSDVSTRISELIFRTDNKTAIRGLKEIADQGESTTKSLKDDSEEQTASFRKVEASSTALRDSMMGLAGMVGIGGVAFGLRDLKNSAVALQSSQAQLDNMMHNTGQAAGGAAEKLKAYAEALSTRGGFGTTANLGALTAFVGETHNAAQAQSMLALATNIARARTMDLASAQSIVARAYTGSVGKLQSLLGPMVKVRDAQVGLTVAHERALVPIEDQAALMGKLGGAYLRNQEIAMHLTAQQQALAQMTDKHATAQQVLADATKYFAGATATYSKQTQGQASNLSNSFHNLTEELGTALLPAMDWLIARGASVAEWMAKNKTVVLALVGAFTALGAALGLSKLIKAVSGLGDDIVKLARRYGIMGAAGEEAGVETAVGAEDAKIAWNSFFTGTLIGIGLVALLEIGTHFKQFQSLVLSVWHAIEGAAVGAWQGIESGVTKGVDFVWSKIKWLGDEAKKLLADTPLGGIIGLGSNLLQGHVSRGLADFAQGATGGIFNANTGTIGAPYRNLTSSSYNTPSAAAAQAEHITIQPGRTSVNIDGREITNAVTRYALNRAARGPSSFVGGSLVTASPGLPVGHGLNLAISR